MDAIGYLKRNKKQIERSCVENWIENDIDDIIERIIRVIKELSGIKENKSETNQYFEEWFNSLKPEYVGVYRQWLLRAFNDDMSFVYASNALIRSLNRDLGGGGAGTVSQINTTIWERYLTVRDSVNLKSLKEEIRYYFPDIHERSQFLSFTRMQLSKDFIGPELSDDERVKLIKELDAETNLEIEKASINTDNKKRDIINQQQLADDCKLTFVQLFEEPGEIYAELVKEVLDEMRLTKDGKLLLTYSPRISSELKSSTDRKEVGINVLAYVFAALKDPDNKIRYIKHGYHAPQLKVFYSEFGIKVTEHSPKAPPVNSTVIRNLTKVTSKDNLGNRRLNDVYQDFTLRYKEKLK